MKKINFILGALVCLFAFSACTDEVDYTPATSADAEGVYFPSTLPAQVDLSADTTSFDVLVYRADSVGEETVAVQAVTSDTTGVFTFPSSVTFADGSTSAAFTITYDLSKMSYDQYFDISLSVDQSITSAYGYSSYSFTAGIPGPYASLGVGKYYDYMFLTEEVEVEIQQSILDPTVFRLVEPYHVIFGEPYENTGRFLYFRLLQQGESLGSIQVAESDLVFFEEFNTGFVHPTYGAEINLCHPALFSGMTASDIVWNKVLSYQENGLPAQVQLAPLYYMYGVGGFPYYNQNGVVTITFPGVVLTDYSVEMEYLGKFVDASDNTSAEISVTMGDDVAYVKVAMANTADEKVVYDGIIDGSLNPIDMEEDGVSRFLMSRPGVYTAVAVSYNSQNEPQSYGSVQFEYTAGGPVWNTLGMAQYTDGFVCATYIMQPATYEVEIQESDETPGLYRLVNPYGEAFPYNEPGDWDSSKDYYLEINAVDPQGVYIEPQSLGFDWGDGIYYASSMAGYYLAGGNSLEAIKNAGYCGTLADGVISFPTQTLLVAQGAPSDWATESYIANLAYDEEANPIAGYAPFKVVLPSAASQSTKSVKAIESKSVVKSKKSVRGIKLSKMDKVLLQKVEKR